MPRREDLKRILVIGAGPIVIGQACEFDYSGTQACKALRSEGLDVILINSNPATIMTDPEMADRTYIEPLTVEAVTKVIEKERPDAILPTVGGQTALNLAVALHEAGVLDKYGVKLIGANVDAIKLGEDRLLFRDAMKEIGVETPASGLARSIDEATRIVKTTGFPAIIRPSFTMGGVGGGIAYNIEEFRELVERGLEMSPVHELLIEESVIGWKEFELEVMRDVADNFVVICSIENIDPMGVHTGDSITVAPALTLTDKEYQRMRDAARRIINEVGVETGGSNIQFCVNPRDGRMLVIEMNPRVSRSSALASKATGFPIAKIAAKLALGYHLDEIPNDITRLTPASFEPTIDYIVTKIPRWNFEKFPQADRTLTTQMKSVGEAMSIGRTFKESFLKGVRSLELGKQGLLLTQPGEEEDDAALRKKLVVPNDRRMWALFKALERGWTVEQLHELTHIDPWFLEQFSQIAELRRIAGMQEFRELSADFLRTLKRAGFGDREIAAIYGVPEATIRERRIEDELVPAFKRIDTCAAEFESFTPYMYSTYEKGDESNPTDKSKVVILGSGPNRIGQGLEFDYCCCHAAFALRDAGFETIMINCNPETVSTDYDTTDRLYFEPLTFEDVMSVIDREATGGGEVACLVQFGGQTPLKLSLALQAAGVKILGTSPGLDRPCRRSPAVLAAAVGSRHSAAGERHRHVARRSARSGAEDRVPGRRAAVVRARRAGDGDRVRHGHARSLHDERRRCVARASRPDRQVRRRRVRARRRCGRGRNRRRRHRRHHGAHRGGRHSLRRQLLRRAAVSRGRAASGDDSRLHAPHRARAEGRRPDEHAVRPQGRCGVRARGEPARVAHGAVPVEGDRRAAREDGGARDGRQDAVAARPRRRSRSVPACSSRRRCFRSCASRASTRFSGPR